MSENVSTETTPEVTDKEVKTEKSVAKTPDKKNKKQKKGRFAGIKAEFKKISWPERAKVIKNTTAVVLVSIFIAVIVKVSDLLIQAGLDLLL